MIGLEGKGLHDRLWVAFFFLRVIVCGEDSA